MKKEIFEIPDVVLDRLRSAERKKEEEEKLKRNRAVLNEKKEEKERKRKEKEFKQRLKNPLYLGWAKKVEDWIHSFRCNRGQRMLDLCGSITLFEDSPTNDPKIVRTFSICEYDDGRGGSDLNVVYKEKKKKEKYSFREDRICIYSEWYEEEMITHLPEDFFKFLVSNIDSGKVWEFVKMSIPE